MDPRKWRHTLERATPSKRYPQLKGGYNRALSARRTRARAARRRLRRSLWRGAPVLHVPRLPAAVMRTIVHRVQSLVGATPLPTQARHDLIDRGIQTR